MKKVLKTIREYSQVPVIMLTAKGEETDAAAADEAGNQKADAPAGSENGQKAGAPADGGNDQPAGGAGAPNDAKNGQKQ